MGTFRAEDKTVLIITNFVHEIDMQIERLQAARKALAMCASDPTRPAVTATHTKWPQLTGHKPPAQRRISPEGRARISAAVKARWAARRGQV